ncbi:hypothetical protein [Saccharopolyspora gloriosae]|uniref:hypothetical protein n=1 Tax=Saccharopolyspora gloriosae TaxID=455344 RepID=UPI001FB68CF5|nr:hypothetical protein [Saccharopolyspora gloriosae]
MEVEDFDERLVCEENDQPTFQAELWSWHVDAHGARGGTVRSGHLLTGCEVHEALDWCERNVWEPGCFVLHAGTWTNCGFVRTVRLSGRPPGYGEPGRDESSAVVTFEV